MLENHEDPWHTIRVDTIGPHSVTTEHDSNIYDQIYSFVAFHNCFMLKRQSINMIVAYFSLFLALDFLFQSHQIWSVIIQINGIIVAFT
jgi:hypothetical protein